MGFFSKRAFVILLGSAIALGSAVYCGVRLHHHRSSRKSDHPASSDVNFARDVAPIFSESCLECHGPNKQKGGLRLDVRATVFNAVTSGDIAVIPGDTTRSDLMRRITSSDPDEQMPPKGARLDPKKIEVLRHWIESGAVWPGDSGPGPQLTAGMVVSEKDRQHWSYRPLARTDPPVPATASWAINPIDRFILAAQEAKGLHPNPQASKRTLIRRLSFDLIGLPPTPEEIDAFERDSSPDAYGKLVDRLLASPHYGERWGRHWLDVARYADSAGYEEDRPRPNAWRYRDFVIQAFNADVPYDKFIQWQVAGDLLAPGNHDALIATGFITAAPDVRPDFINFRKKDRFDELDDIVSTTGSAILGLTLGCARCHDHKFDPLPMADYYRFTAFFTGTERNDRPLNAAQGEEYERLESKYDKQFRVANKELTKWVAKLTDRVRLQKIDALPVSDAEKALLRAPKDDGNVPQKALLDRFQEQLRTSHSIVRASISTSEQAKWDELDRAVKQVEATEPADIPRVLSIDEGKPQKTYLLARGNPDQPGPEVTSGFLTVLTPPGASNPNAKLSRADLARWLTDDVHGAGALTARVAANRLWQHHFGCGLVETPGDFGNRGDSPSNSALLDWLASELIRSGWKLSRIQKLILTSATYRQDISSDPDRSAIDPADRLWWRRNPERIEAEVLRDSILAVSGRLNNRLYGPAVKPHINSEAITITNPAKNYDEWPANVVDGPDTWRRSVYIFIKRANLFPFLQSFDAPNAIGSCTRRNPTTVAPQALTLLNEAFVRDQARAFAARLAPIGSTEERIQSAFLLAFGRKPTAHECETAVAFITAQADEYRSSNAVPQPDAAALADFCQSLFASNEFSFID